MTISTIDGVIPPAQAFEYTATGKPLLLMLLYNLADKLIYVSQKSPEQHVRFTSARSEFHPNAFIDKSVPSEPVDRFLKDQYRIYDKSLNSSKSVCSHNRNGCLIV